MTTNVIHCSPQDSINEAMAMMTDRRCVKEGRPAEECEMRPVIYNYSAAFKEAPLLRYLLNGVIVTLSIFAIQIVVALPCAYALAKLRFWGRDLVFGLVIFCLLIPVHAIALPLYIMLAKAGLTNTYAALVIPWTISVFGIFLMRQFFKTVPDDLIDAARMDGMSEFSIVWRVMLPTAVPALLISVAGALITTRSGTEEELAADVTGQVLSNPKPLGVAAGLLGGNPAPSLRIPGSRIYAQVWARDTLQQSLLSDAVTYTVCQ